LEFHISHHQPQTSAAMAASHNEVAFPSVSREKIVSFPLRICRAVISSSGATHTIGKRVCGHMPIPTSPAHANMTRAQPAHCGIDKLRLGSRSIPAVTPGIEAKSSIVLSTAGKTVENGTVA